MQSAAESEMSCSGSGAHEQLPGEHNVKEMAADVGNIQVQLVKGGWELTASQARVKEVCITAQNVPAVEANGSPRTVSLEMPKSKRRAEKKSSRTLFVCEYPDCGKSFLSYHSLKAHGMVHSGVRPFVCEWCDRAFTSFYSLTAHCRTHTGQRPYKCTAAGCTKSFKSSSDLRRHSRVHSGDKPYACTYRGCFKTFSTLDIRKVHMRTHTGDRPFACNQENCTRSFASKTNLKNHMRTHTGEKPFKCKHPGCEKSFGEHSTLYKHQLVHDKSSVACEECKRRFRSPSKLQAHRAREHGYVLNELPGVQTEETVQSAPGAESPQRIQLLLTELDVRTLEIDGETAQVLVLPADGSTGQEPNVSSDLNLLNCAGALVVEGGVTSDLVVTPAEMTVDDPEPGEVGLSVVVEDQATS